MEFPPDHNNGSGAQVSSSSSSPVLGKRRRVGLVYDERMCKHSTPKGETHPENPDRIRAIWNKLVSAGIPNKCVVYDAKQVEDKYLAAVHTESHINLMKTISSKRMLQRNKVAAKYNSIYFNEGSSESAYLAAGSVLEAAEKVAKGELNSAFAIVRPPGHHAEKSEPMGFCLFNNVAIATRFLLDQKELNINKILLVDWDVHHGNGTQKMFYKDPRVLVFSVHRHEHGSFYPTGEDGSHIMTGEGRGAGYNINVPWDNGQCGDADYIAVWDHILIPVAKEFKPDIILISAGFDAAVGDPLGGSCVTPHGFSILLKKLMEFSRGKIIMALEGGYNLDSLANSVLACVEVLLEDKPVAGSMEVHPFESTWGVIKAVHEQLSAFWPILAYKLPIKLTSRVTPEVQIYSSHSSNDYDDGLDTSSGDLQEDVTVPPRDLDHSEDSHAWRFELLKDVASIKNEVPAIKEGKKCLERVVKADKKLKNKLLFKAANDCGQIKYLKKLSHQPTFDDIIPKYKSLADEINDIIAEYKSLADKEVNDIIAKFEPLADKEGELDTFKHVLCLKEKDPIELHTKRMQAKPKIDVLKKQRKKSIQKQRLVVKKLLPHVVYTLHQSDEFRNRLLKVMKRSYKLGRQHALKDIAKTIPGAAFESYDDGTMLDRFTEAHKEFKEMKFPYINEIAANADESLEFLMNIKPKKHDIREMLRSLWDF